MASNQQPDRLLLAADIAARYGTLPQVEAVALAGSQTTNVADPGSDLDLYVYVREPIPVDERQKIAMTKAERAEVDNQFWEPGDEWIDAGTHIGIDVMYRTVQWIEEQLARVLQRHEASVGYSTCFWHNILSSQVLYERDGWFQHLQEAASQPYPEPLRRAIIAKNHPILRDSLSSYLHQIERASARDDLVSVNHRVAALLASYFDILFAVNRLPHPGEKRLLAIAAERCEKVPQGMQAHVTALIRAIPQDRDHVISQAEKLLDALDRLLEEEGL